ncbi:YbgC/FadM family acyl-CoA thioesterase [Kordiimonas lacus]|uniref:Acyl-CoA thioester hydrolase n=1 Tax=Kordiimonas lacus TaxID=637679 RepID=A0A1G6YT62_9PROT|nr:YbgC/FadM family acyl-CoA thioesterase [Kordiimonas lacus]SDD93472.1 acyl-CoA thioester hydrolase [Kordiimonas lacus]
MNTPQTAEGAWQDGVFQFPIRVYYEDTDVGGMVYHGRYVSFFERVRTESIRNSAADVNYLFDLAESEGGPLTYVVSNINIRYHRQAKIGDVLMGHSMVTRVRAAAIEVKQWITRDGEMVAEADVLVAVIGNDGRPRRWPNSAKKCWQDWMEAAAAAQKN